MNAEQRVKVLEDEVKLLKNEIKAILMDIREHYLEYQNPFTHDELSHAARIDVSLSEQMPPRAGRRPKSRADEPRDGTDEEQAPDNISKDDSSCTAPAASQGQDEGATSASRANPASRGDEQPMLTHPGVNRSEVSSRHRHTGSGQADLVTIASLSQWVDETIAVIGKERLTALVDVCRMTGRLTEGTKDLITTLSHPYPATQIERRVTGKDYLAVLAHLEKVLNNNVEGEILSLPALSNSQEPTRRSPRWVAGDKGPGTRGGNGKRVSVKT